MSFNEQKRLFIGNLPPDIQDHELKKEFSYYGVVNKVEVKQKVATEIDNVQNTFAFITISIDDHKLNNCLQEFKDQQFRGRYLQVTVARENFLEKLKREREEAAQLKEKKEDTNKSKTETETVKVSLPTIQTGDSSSSESSSDDSSEDESPPQQSKPVTKLNGSKKIQSSSGSSDSESDHDEENLVLKKKSKIFLENGKIKIDRTVSSGEAIHVIEKKARKTIKKELDENSKKADQKRLESLNKMKNSYNEQKLAIKKALAGVDTMKKSNKIVFSDADEEETSAPASKQAAKVTPQTKSKEKEIPEKNPTLFDEEDSDDDKEFAGNFEIKQQFEGKKGEKLRRLQDRFQADSRFKMDSKFLEADSDNDETASKQKEQQIVAKSSDDIETNEIDERQWQLKILESVIGKKVQSNSAKETHKKAPPSMLRFDPTRADHTKFVEPKVKKRKAKANNEPNSKRAKTEENFQHEVEAEPVSNEPPVSMDHFYEVRGDLKKSLGSGGFSLLSMFNRPADNIEQTITTEKPYEEKLIAKNGVKFLADLDPFKYDSSGDEADIDDKKKERAETKVEVHTKIPELKYESFFTQSLTDERLSEALTLFNPPVSDEIEESNANTNGYDDAKRQELKNIVKRKIKKSIQNALPRHAKPNKRFKRFAKNL